MEGEENKEQNPVQTEQAPMQDNMNAGGDMNMDQESNGSTGAMIGVIVILVIIALGGLYFWSERGDVVVEDTATVTDETIEAIGTQGTADDTSSIEADLDATDIENIDAELNAL